MTNQPERLMALIPEGQAVEDYGDDAARLMGATRVGPWTQVEDDDPAIATFPAKTNDGDRYWYGMATKA